VYTDFENLVKQTRHILPYSKFYFSGVLGGGLAILSKWPIESTTMWQYPLNGRPTAFWRGDWYVGKGVASALIRHSSGKLIEIFNTHVRSLCYSLTVVACTIWEGGEYVFMSPSSSNLAYSEIASIVGAAWKHRCWRTFPHFMAKNRLVTSTLHQGPWGIQ
jgi:hypothetical protein